MKHNADLTGEGAAAGSAVTGEMSLLAINARDAMPTGGNLRIETHNIIVSDQSIPTLSPRIGEYVSICVVDTGVGTDLETSARAFEPFFTTKPMGQGTGLDLSRIYGFARQSDGHARIESAVGKGTRFVLSLPRFTGEEDRNIAERGALIERSSSEMVLVVEDDPVVRSLAIEVLDELGYRALEAGDGLAG